MAFVFPNFAAHAGLRYGFSDRSDGSLSRHTEKENRRRYFQGAVSSPDLVATADLIHGATALAVDEAAAGQMITAADALATDRPGLYLSATSADCFLVYFYDPKRRAVAIAHAGWRGVLSGIVTSTLNLLITRYDSSPADVLIGIGPGIRSCHFEINPRDREKYAAYPEAMCQQEGRVFVDLPAIITSQLKPGGIRPENIADCGICTYCQEETYFSYRRDHPLQVQAMAGYIGLK